MFVFICLSLLETSSWIWVNDEFTPVIKPIEADRMFLLNFLWMKTFRINWFKTYTENDCIRLLTADFYKYFWNFIHTKTHIQQPFLVLLYCYFPLTCAKCVWQQTDTVFVYYWAHEAVSTSLVKAKQTWQSELRGGGWAAEMWAFKQVRFKINEFTELYMMQWTKIQSLKSAWNIPSGKDQFEKLKDAKISFVFMNA